MEIELDDALVTGIPLIDAQHRELILRINALLEACREGRGKEELERTTSYLERYIREHFETEEKVMADLNYPDRGSHQEHHRRFIVDFSSLRARIEHEGPGVHLVVHVNKALREWFVEHVEKVDKAMAEFIKAEDRRT